VESDELKTARLYSLISIALIIFTGLLVYSNSFGLGWHYDDEPNILYNPAIKDIHNLKAIWGFDTSRFLSVFSIALNYHFGGVLVFGYHVVNLIIHITAACLVWLMVSLFFQTPVLKNFNNKSALIILPLFAGLIFAAHPVQTQAVTYIVQRAASLAGMFYIAAVVFYLKYKLSAEGSAGRKVYYLMTLVTCVMAMFSKEISFTLPFMLLAVEFFFFSGEGKFSFVKFIPFLLTLFIIPFVVLYLHPSAMKETAEASGRISSLTYLMTQFRVITTYIRIYFFPVNLNLDYDFPLSKSFFEVSTLLSFLFLVIIVAGAAFLFKKHRVVSFGILWFFLTLAVESSVWPIKDVTYEHRLYLPLAGLTVSVLFGLYELFTAKNIKYFIALFTVLIIAAGWGAYQRNFVWESEMTLWTDVMQKSPAKYRAYINRGLAHLRRFALDKAMADFQKGLTLDPNNSVAYCNMGAIYGLREENEAALECFNKSIILNPKYEEAYNNRGSLLYRMGKIDAAFADLNTAIKIKPGSTAGYNNRGTLYFMLGRYDEALKDYITALQIDPLAKDILKNAGLAFDKKNERLKAIDYYNKSLEIDPNNLAALFNRAVDLYYMNKTDLAKKDIARMKMLGVDASADFETVLKSLNLK